MKLIPPKDTSFRHGIMKYRISCKEIKLLFFFLMGLFAAGALLGLAASGVDGIFESGISFLKIFSFPFCTWFVYVMVGNNIKVTVDNKSSANYFTSKGCETIATITGIAFLWIIVYGFEKFGIAPGILIIVILIWFLDHQIEKSCNWQDAKDYSILCCQKYGIYIPNSDDLKTISEVRNTVESILINQKNTPEP